MDTTKHMQVAESQELLDRHQKALEFAKALAQQVVHDPTGQTSRRKSRTYSKGTFTRENIESYLESPTSNEANLRNASNYLYQTNNRYRNLLQYYANLPCWYYVVSALNFDPEKVKKPDAFRKQYQKVCNILESMGVIKTMREISLVALREGVYYGVVWGGDGNSFILQKLDPDMCQITSITDGGVFRFAVDMNKINEADLDTHYPPQFRTMWNAAQNGNQYQEVPPEISVCLKADPSVVEYSIPPFAGVLPTLFSIKNVESQAEASGELNNYKLLAGTIPVDDDGVPLVDYKTVMQYYGHLAGNVGERVGVAFTPFELKSYDFEQNGTTSQIDTVARATENFFASAGTSALLHGATNSTAGVTKLAIKADETFSFGLMYQCEKIVNRWLKTLSGTQKFKITFLPATWFSLDEMLSKYKESLNYGIGKLQYMALLNIPQHDILNLNYIENEVLQIDTKLIPLKTSSTQSADDVKGGRPEATDAEVGDAGEETRDSGANDDR